MSFKELEITIQSLLDILIATSSEDVYNTAVHGIKTALPERRFSITCASCEGTEEITSEGLINWASEHLEHEISSVMIDEGPLQLADRKLKETFRAWLLTKQITLTTGQHLAAESLIDAMADPFVASLFVGLHGTGKTFLFETFERFCYERLNEPLSTDVQLMLNPYLIDKTKV